MAKYDLEIEGEGKVSVDEKQILLDGNTIKIDKNKWKNNFFF